MAAPKRTKHQRELDLERISAMYLTGLSQDEIARRVGVSQGQVSYDLKEIHRRWREQTTLNIDEAKQRELERIDVLERTYWDAWRLSKEERTKTRTSSKGQDKSASIEKESLTGNPAYLAGVQWCIEQRCKLLGLNAPTRTEVTGKDGSPVEQVILVTLGGHAPNDPAQD